MHVVLACNFPRDERLGSSRVPLRVADELEKIGVRVSTLFSEELARFGGARVEQITSPFRMAAALAGRAAGADVVDIAGFDAWAYAYAARALRPRQAIVARSNGLWDRALATNGDVGQGAGRAVLSRLYQQHVMCRWERASITAADLALFGARGDGDEVVRRGWKTPAEVAVVAPGVDASFASAVPLDQRQDVVFVGSFLHRKGCDVAVAAMSQVLAGRPRAALTFLGPGHPPDDILARFPEGVRGRVSVVAALPSTELAREMGRYAVLVFPTRYEGFGLVTLEAMRAGLAVVTTPTGAGTDVVRDGENGLLVPIEDVAATAQAVGRLLDEPQLRMRLGRAAAEEASARTWARTATETAGAYERALELAGRRARRP
jgi:glycosyltransferase involved in cell wall biosynthesis